MKNPEKVVCRPQLLGSAAWGMWSHFEPLSGPRAGNGSNARCQRKREKMNNFVKLLPSMQRQYAIKKPLDCNTLNLSLRMLLFATSYVVFKLCGVWCDVAWCGSGYPFGFANRPAK